MITGAIKSQVDRVWDAFWSGGISNPLEVMEQITYLLFLRRLDDLHTLEENKSARVKKPMERRRSLARDHLPQPRHTVRRWGRLLHLVPRDKDNAVREASFPLPTAPAGRGQHN